MILYHKDAKPVQVFPGLTRRTLVQGDSMMVCEFIFDSHVTVPIHSHPHEQVGYIVKGSVEMNIDGEVFLLSTGDSYFAPSTVQHGAYTLEPTIILDTFNPPREDYR
jgi:quercetin dioxygenase-like cupin family protein